MTEFFLPFLIGYGVARILTFLLSSNRQTAVVNKRNVILKWDNGSFAWRPIPLVSIEDSSARYMIAASVDYESIKLLKLMSESENQ